MTQSYNDLLVENAELKRQIKRMRYKNLANSIEFERLKKLAGEAIIEVDKVINRAEAYL